MSFDAIPTLGDALGGAKPAVSIAGRSRVHRIAKVRVVTAPTANRLTPTPDDVDEVVVESTDEPGGAEPIITPFIEPPPRESAMPRRKAVAAAPPAEPTPEKRKYTKRKAAPAKGPKPEVGAARFQIDDRGGMSIEDGQQSIKIERNDVKRLELFLEQTKAIRK